VSRDEESAAGHGKIGELAYSHADDGGEPGRPVSI
jgi:hypothetical protein